MKVTPAPKIWFSELVKLIKQLFSMLQFVFVVLYRFIALILKVKKSIRIRSVNYFKDWYFDKTLLLLKLEVDNVLWAEINGFKSISYSEVIGVDLALVQEGVIKIELVGLFEKKSFLVKIEDVQRLESKTFSIGILNPKGVQLNLDEKILILSPKKILQYKILVKSEKVFFFQAEITKRDSLELLRNEFNLSEYI